MKKISFFLLASLFLASCDPVITYEYETDITTINDTWSWDFALAGEIDTLFECSVIYTTNYLLAETSEIEPLSNTVTSQWDNEGMIERYTLYVDYFRADDGEPSSALDGSWFGTGDVYVETDLAYGDTHVNVLYFPYSASLIDILAPTFDIKIIDVTVSYPHDGLGAIYPDDTFTMSKLECFYVYFLALYNESYETARSAISVESPVMQSEQYDIMPHFMSLYGYDSEKTDRCSIAEELKDNPDVMANYKKFIDNLNKELATVCQYPRMAAMSSLPSDLIDMAQRHIF